MAGEIVEAREPPSPPRAWWLRVPAVLLGPRPVFFALRDDDDDDVAARSEPLLLVIWLAGIAAVLATPTAATLLDNPSTTRRSLAIWAFVAGGVLRRRRATSPSGSRSSSACACSGASATSGARARRSASRSCPLAALARSSLLPLAPRALRRGHLPRGRRGRGNGRERPTRAAARVRGWSLVLLVIGVRVDARMDAGRARSAASPRRSRS